ncbi:hypothetical protein PMI18_06060 [Pseudomonas sp. GM102]|nr:hypothetical protein PMI18_06060 [Pseudomonas sp. GM102]
MSLTRADFHEQNQASAHAEAQRLLAQKAVLQGGLAELGGVTDLPGGVRQHGQKRACALAGTLRKVIQSPRKQEPLLQSID